jgi:hypothetical protein
LIISSISAFYILQISTISIPFHCFNTRFLSSSRLFGSESEASTLSHSYLHSPYLKTFKLSRDDSEELFALGDYIREGFQKRQKRNLWQEK